MIIGNGLIASGLKSIDDMFPEVLFFASGVSNSKENNEFNYKREERLLLESINNNKGKLIVYFSTYSVNDSERKYESYTLHKIKMEGVVKNNSNYVIFRLTNVVGYNGNKANLFNFLINNISSGKDVTVWKNANRNIVDIEDLSLVVKKILKTNVKNITILLAHPYSYSISELIIYISNYFKIQPKLLNSDKGSLYDFKTESIVKEAFLETVKNNKEYYIGSLLQKYYPLK